jgi:hypothetical protein
LRNMQKLTAEMRSLDPICSSYSNYVVANGLFFDA